MNYIFIFRIFLLYIVLFLAVECNHENHRLADCFPSTSVNVALNLSLVSYSPLNSTSGWVYVDAEFSGTRGLIVVKTPNGYAAYDRNAPHLCPSENSTLEVRDNLYIYCPEDESKWILITGEPLEKAGVPPKKYSVYTRGSILHITGS